MRDSLKILLETCLGLRVRGEFGSAEDALSEFEEAEETPPDMMLVDLSLPGKNGIELISDVKSRWPDTRCVVISGQSDAGDIEQSVHKGAEAFVLKGNPNEILEAVRQVLKEETYMSPELVRRMEV